MILKIILLASLVISSTVFAQSVSDIPGLIPLKNQRPAASDLIYNGKNLLPDEARKLQESGVIKDLSLIEPDESSVLWKSKPTQDLVTPERNVGLDLSRPFEFLEYSPEVVERLGFTVSQKNASGVVKIYRVRLDSRVHNVLLRRNLLRKLGYNIPATVWAPQMKVAFKGSFSRDEFIKQLKTKTFVEPKRWVVGQQEAELTLQDAVIFEGAADIFYNLARGDMPASVIAGRRVLNALLVPYNLVDVTESVNVFSWKPGKIFNEQLSLPYEDSASFSTSYEDARWISRKILSLTREDLVEIVKQASYPPEVETVLIEKIISRRNFLRELLNLENESREIAVNTKVPKLEKQEWAGYVQNFAYGDPDSPLSGPELFSFFKSKVTTNLISNLVTEFNTRFVPRTDLGFKLFDHQLDLAARQFAEFIRTGKVEKTPFAFFTIPTFSGNLIASREVVTGSYLGTDNLVQLADVVGFSVDAGLYIGADGLPSKVGFSGAVKAFVTRTYAHIKPIKSIKLALKEPFKNIIVPNFKGNIGSKLERVFSEEYQKLDESKKHEELKALTSELKENLKVGESIIVSTTLGGLINASPTLGLADQVRLVTSWTKTQSLLSRVHIFRSSDNTIQIYRDPAHVNDRSFYVGIEAYIPVIGFDSTRKEGSAQTNFFTVDISEDASANTGLEDNLKALSRIFLYSKLDALKVLQKPYVIEHKFLEKGLDVNIFHWIWKNQRTKDLITVKHPEGFTKNFIKRTIGKRSGKNYEDLSINILNSLIREYTEQDIVVQANNSGDPADSVFGSSVSKLFSFEAEIKKENGQEVISDPYVSITYKWRNWSLNKDKLLNLISDINNKFKFEFFHPSEFQSTNKVKLSTVSVTASIYEEGIAHLMTYTKEQIADVLRAHGADHEGPTDPPTGSRIRRPTEAKNAKAIVTLKAFTRLKEAYAAGRVDDTIKSLSDFTALIEILLPYRDFYQLFGGEKNIFVRTQVLGFRDGDEKEDSGLISSSLGKIGSQKSEGPLREIQLKMGISESEFLIYWLMNKI